MHAGEIVGEAAAASHWPRSSKTTSIIQEWPERMTIGLNNNQRQTKRGPHLDKINMLVKMHHALAGMQMGLRHGEHTAVCEYDCEWHMDYMDTLELYREMNMKWFSFWLGPGRRRWWLRMRVRVPQPPSPVHSQCGDEERIASFFDFESACASLYDFCNAIIVLCWCCTCASAMQVNVCAFKWPNRRFRFDSQWNEKLLEALCCFVLL